VNWVKAHDVPNRNFDILVCPAGAIHSQAWQQCLQHRRWKAFVVTEFDAQRDGTMLDTIQRIRAVRRICIDPMVFWLQ
jgi:hypothetical protein